MWTGEMGDHFWFASGWQCGATEGAGAIATDHSTPGWEHVGHGSSRDIQQQDRLHHHLPANRWNDVQRWCWAEWVDQEAGNAGTKRDQVLGGEAQAHRQVSRYFYILPIFVITIICSWCKNLIFGLNEEISVELFEIKNLFLYTRNF